ncbi:MAG: hypothetical protein M1828_002222 [Chrysothrix sp. TS-e1954]|nr:MAG: hypothetical protein M1828_002222 [Chrysothrix sp. TS-e1954]
MASQTERRSQGSQTPFSASVELDASLPTLLLEDINWHLADVRCRPSTIELDFSDPELAAAIWRRLQEAPKIMVVTSHFGCNLAGERKPYFVHDMRRSASTVLLDVRPTSWDESFQHVQVHLEQGDHDLHDLRVEPLRKKTKRKAVGMLANTQVSNASTTSIDFPTAPTATPTSTDVHQASIDHSWMDTAILPPNFPGVDDISLHGPGVPHGLTLNCKDCSIQGVVDLSFANFTVGNIADEAFSFVEDGILELTINDFSAHVELESTVEVSARLLTVPFPDIGIPGLVIPGLASVGPVFRPIMTFGIQLSTQLDFTYGFDLNLPGKASIMLDIRDPSNSNMTGFENAQLSAVPFQSQINDIDLTVSLGFSPQLLLTVSAFENHGHVNVGAFLDLPRLSTKLSQVDHVDDECNPTNDTDSFKDFVNNSLTNIVPSVDLGIGVLAGVKLDVPDVPELDASHTIFSTGYPLPTACLKFDEANKSYGAAKSANTSAADKKSGSLSLRYDCNGFSVHVLLLGLGYIMSACFRALSL